MSTLITYGGAIVAVASSSTVHFVGPADDLPMDAPLRRFVIGMALYARDIEAGTLDGAFDQEDAELYARSLLIDDAEFLARAGDTEEQLAEYFTVPVEQVTRKRAETQETVPEV